MKLLSQREAPSRALVTVISLTLFAAPAFVVAAADDAAVVAQLAEQARRIQVLERKLELQNEANQATTSSTTVPKASAKGFSIASADGANIVKFRGTLHFDGRFFVDEITPETSDTWILRRVRPTIEGTIAKI